jgi:hypothetical protein
MKKGNLGILIILGGVALMGYVWFKKNKPSISDKQLADLTAQSNALNTGRVETIDKPFQYTQEQINNAGSNPYSQNTFSPDYSTLSPENIKQLEASINQICPNCAGLDTLGTNQIALNMQNADLSQLGNFNFGSVNWSNIKI